MILFQKYVLRGYPLESLVNATEKEKRLLRHALIMEREEMNDLVDDKEGEGWQEE